MDWRLRPRFYKRTGFCALRDQDEYSDMSEPYTDLESSYTVCIRRDSLIGIKDICNDYNCVCVNNARCSYIRQMVNWCH